MNRQVTRRTVLRLVSGIGAAVALSACTRSTPPAAPGGATTAPAAKSGDGAAAPKDGGSLVVGLEAEPGTLDSSVGTGYHTSIVQNHIFETLVWHDLTSTEEPTPVRPLLAESWDISPDGRVYTFKLRTNVKFHDGTPFDAEAVKFCYDRVTDPQHPFFFDKGRGTTTQVFTHVEKMEAVDPATFRITLKEPRAYFLDLMDRGGIWIGSPAAIKKHGNDEFGNHPVGTGPFRFASRETGSRITLERNPDYWGTAPHLDKLVLRGIPEATARALALQSGEVDFINDVAPDQIEVLRANPNIEIAQTSIPHTWLINVNHREQPFSDMRVRQAMSYAIDREALCRDILKGTALPATQLEGPGSVAYDEALAGWPHDPAKAKQLLAEAGYASGFETVFALPSTGSGMLDAVRIAEFLQRNWADVGVRVKLETHEWTSYLPYFFQGIPAGKGMFAMANVTGDGQDMEKLNLTDFHPPRGFNVGWFKNDQVEQLLVNARTTPDRAAAAKTYQQVEKILNDEVAMIYVLHSQQPKAYNKKVRGFVNPHSWAYTFRNVWLA